MAESIAAVRGAGPRGFVRESPPQRGTGHSFCRSHRFDVARHRRRVTQPGKCDSARSAANEVVMGDEDAGQGWMLRAAPGRTPGRSIRRTDLGFICAAVREGCGGAGAARTGPPTGYDGGDNSLSRPISSLMSCSGLTTTILVILGTRGILARLANSMPGAALQTSSGNATSAPTRRGSTIHNCSRPSVMIALPTLRQLAYLGPTGRTVGFPNT